MKTIFTSLVIMLLTLTSVAQGIITTIAGGGWGGDGGLATDAWLDMVNDVLVDTNGNVYIAEETAIRKIDAQTQMISLYAGSYQGGIGCDGCPATSAKLNHANAIAFDKQGNLYIADWGTGRIRKVDAVTGIMTTYAGNSTIGYSGDGGPATSAQLRKPMDIAFDANDNLYIADEFYHIRRVDRQTGIITTIAGDGTLGSWNNGDLAVSSRIGAGRGICVDFFGNIYFTDPNSRRIGKIDTQGILSVYCGTGTAGLAGDGGPAVNAQTYASVRLRMDSQNNMYFGDGGGVVRRIDYSTGVISRVAGNGTGGYSGDGGPALQAQFYGVRSVVVDRNNDAYIVDGLNYRVRKIFGVVGVVPSPEMLSFEIYPNPSNGLFTVQSSDEIDLLQVRNLTGQIVYESNPLTPSARVDLSNHPAGVYMVTVVNGPGMISKKIIIHH